MLIPGDRMDRKVSIHDNYCCNSVPQPSILNGPCGKYMYYQSRR